MGLYKQKNSPYWWYNFKLDGKDPVRGSTKVLIKKSANDQWESAENRKKAEMIFNEKRNEVFENQVFKKPTKVTVDGILRLKNESANGWHYEGKYFGWNLRAVIDYFGAKVAHKITKRDIKEFQKKRATEVSPDSVNKDIMHLCSAYENAMEDGILFENPTAGIEKFDCTERRRVKVLNPQDKMDLINGTSGLLQDLIVFAMRTGMRQGEIRGIRHSDIDTLLRKIKVTSYKGRKTLVRYVPYDEVTEKIILGQPRTGEADEYLFKDEDGKPLSRFCCAHSTYQRIIKKLNIHGGDFTFHDLRHVFASDFLMNGGSLSELQTILGHTKHDTTRRYAHFTNEHLSKAINVLPKLEYERKTEQGIETLCHNLVIRAVSSDGRVLP